MVPIHFSTIRYLSSIYRRLGAYRFTFLPPFRLGSLWRFFDLPPPTYISPQLESFKNFTIFYSANANPNSRWRSVWSVWRGLVVVAQCRSLIASLPQRNGSHQRRPPAAAAATPPPHPAPRIGADQSLLLLRRRWRRWRP